MALLQLRSVLLGSGVGASVDAVRATRGWHRSHSKVGVWAYPLPGRGNATKHLIQQIIRRIGRFEA